MAGRLSLSTPELVGDRLTVGSAGLPAPSLRRGEQLGCHHGRRHSRQQTQPEEV